MLVLLGVATGPLILVLLLSLSGLARGGPTALVFFVVILAGSMSLAAAIVFLARTQCCASQCCCDASDAEDALHAPRKQSWRCVASTSCALIGACWLLAGISVPLVLHDSAGAALDAGFVLQAVALALISVVCGVVFVSRIVCGCCDCVYRDEVRTPAPEPGIQMAPTVYGGVDPQHGYTATLLQ